MHIISATDFPYSARKCLFLPAECSPQKSLILLEILSAEFIHNCARVCQKSPHIRHQRRSVNFHHEHCIVPTICPWVSEDAHEVIWNAGNFYLWSPEYWNSKCSSTNNDWNPEKSSIEIESGIQFVESKTVLHDKSAQ